MRSSKVNPSYAFIKFELEHAKSNSIDEILKDLEVTELAKDLDLTLAETNRLIKDPSHFRFETVFQLSLLFDCDFKKLVKLITNYTLNKKGKPSKK